MYKRQVKEINDGIAKTGKVIIGIGCSFVQGQGAVDQSLYDNYNWSYKQVGTPLVLEANVEQQEQIMRSYSGVGVNPGGSLDFTFMEYRNSFLSVLCNKYFNGEYTPINLGIRGCGNRASIKELYFYPDINWDAIKEIVVIYCPSGTERFDFINDTASDHFRWRCMWPNTAGTGQEGRDMLWSGYSKILWSEKFGVMEQLAHAQELVTWCKSKKAKLVVTPGFDRRYNRDFFLEQLRGEVRRNPTGEYHDPKQPIAYINDDSNDKLVDLFPWGNVFKPDGHETFVDLTMSQENLGNTDDYFFQFLGTGSPKGWVTPCAHPSAKAHDKFASLLHKHIQLL